ncbi:aminotransferase class I/II-fold pyridoxal phosphate-dependent enzyme [Chondromyces crocatus]|uniref:8-amino-7-oxononanoate synthase n=1 Tax=Chondromyces crocatus TaxID=52 RepID=A0A0K1E6U3_CHOCO|nr:8-amino-7-oxononanoate synthase [Chondromyces crocatus]AKT36422.1 2-amino-3-ketobutyrate CoA ligase [Chondromyces crocatus]
MVLDPLRHLTEDLAALERSDLLRDPSNAPPPPGALVLCSNDYLGYASLPWGAVDAAVAGGAGASRLVSGNHATHLEAERAIADWLGTEAALLFSSGYAANVGLLSSLPGPGDVIISDALNHASIIDGCRLSRAAVVVVPHLNLEAVETALRNAGSSRRRWVVTEAIFSMDGDRPDLHALRSLCDAHDAALLVDEAHALGVVGPAGAGLCAHQGVRADVRIGTLGKALGLHGAFVAGSTALRTWLWNRARSFVFSTGISPFLASAVVDRVGRAAADDAGRRRLHATYDQLRDGLRKLGAPIPVTSNAPILPWLLDTPGAAVALSRRLAAASILVQPIRPPTVPQGSSRLRITATACHTSQAIEHALHVFGGLLR